LVVPPEVVRLEEQEHPAPGLVADPCRLLWGRCFRQQERRAASGWADYHPPLERRKGGVFHHDEPQTVGEEVDRLVVVVDDEGDG